MAQYKKQHFVAQAYLRRFACDREKRNTLVLRDQNWTPASIRNQCQRDYFFSKVKAQESEESLARGESLLLSIAETAKHHKQAASLLNLLVDLHLRSPKYLHDDASERYEQWSFAFPQFTRGVFLKNAGYEMESDSVDELYYALQCSWRSEKFDSEEGTYVTSDSPCVLLSVRDQISIVMWPLSPTSLLVMHDFRHVGNVLPALEGKQFTDCVNHVIANMCHRCVYSAHSRSPEETAVLAAGVAEASKHQKQWSFDKKTFGFEPSVVALEDQNSLFNFTTNDSPEPILSFGEAKRLLSSGAVRIDHDRKKVEITAQVSPYALFCVSQLDAMSSTMDEDFTTP